MDCGSFLNWRLPQTWKKLTKTAFVRRVEDSLNGRSQTKIRDNGVDVLFATIGIISSAGMRLIGIRPLPRLRSIINRRVNGAWKWLESIEKHYPQKNVNWQLGKLLLNGNTGFLWKTMNGCLQLKKVDAFFVRARHPKGGRYQSITAMKMTLFANCFAKSAIGLWASLNVTLNGLRELYST
jgi:hypothetical protein